MRFFAFANFCCIWVDASKRVGCREASRLRSPVPFRKNKPERWLDGRKTYPESDLTTPRTVSRQQGNREERGPRVPGALLRMRRRAEPNRQPNPRGKGGIYAITACQ